MYLTIIILPLIASVIAGLLGRKIGVKGAQLITSISIFVTVILALIGFYEVALSYSPVSVSLFKWIDLDSILINWSFNFDSLTVSMLIPVLIVSSLVHIYSIGYMENDPHQQRFFSYLSLFTFFMTILVTADNYLVMFLGWEGVGISSYLLISFWFSRIEANKSAVAALLFNRVGDMFLTIGLFGLIFAVNNIDYAIVFPLIQQINNNLLTIIGICFLIGAMAKSAQIGLHIWLPSSMEGPTPVSALIHAATMVTAGVYLLMRSSILLESCPLVLLLTLWLGAITTLFAGTIGLFQNDIKKVIAYSTCSQLGMLFIAVGLSQYNVALFHLVNHAFFKALLFLCAGSIIHAMNDEQDIRKLGGLVKILPFSYSLMVIGSLSLAAMPFLTGFYSKDLIIELAYGQYQFTGLIIYLISVISAIFTMTYSVRLLYLTFLSNANGNKIDYSNSHEGPLTMSIPLIILAIFSIIFGYYSKDFFVGIASNSLADSLYLHCNNVITIDSEFAISQFYKLLPLFSSFIVAMIILYIYSYNNNLLIKLTMKKWGSSIYLFFNQRYWLELLVNNFIVNKGLSLGYKFNKQLDRGAIELIGPNGLNLGLTSMSNITTKLDSGIISNYALFISLGLISFLFFSQFELIGYLDISIKPIIQQLTILYLVVLLIL